MGSSKKVTIGYKYYMGIHMGVCRGPVNAVTHISADGKDVLDNQISDNGQIQIDKPDLFGGDKKEGGIQGTLDMLNGGPTQEAPANLVALLGGDVPGFRGICTLFYDGLITAMNPYIKPWKIRVRRTTAGWQGGCWYESRATIWMNNRQIMAMNPAHIIYEALTNREWGGGISTGAIDDASFRRAADNLANEGFGLCLRWCRTESVANFIQEVLNHISGVLYIGRGDGTFHLRLIRDDYTAANLPLFTPETGLLEIRDDETAASANSANEIVVSWHDPIENKDRKTRARNIARIQADGQIYSNTVDYVGIPTADLAAKVASREIKTQSAGLKRFRLTLNRRAWNMVPGDVFRISAPLHGIENLVLRAGRVDYGKLTDGKISVEAVMDVFGLPSNAIIEGQGSTWTPPDYTPYAIPAQYVFELTHRDVVALTGVESLDSGASIVGAVALRPEGLAYGYELQTRVGTNDWETVDDGQWGAQAKLAAAVARTETVWSINNAVNLEAVAIGEAARIDNEIVRITAKGADTITVARGCADTLPEAHSSGATIWFTDSAATDSTSYGTGVAVRMRLLTRASSGAQDPASATTSTITTRARQGKPYPPANVEINGEHWPDAISGVMNITWAHRDRIVQADQLVDYYNAASSGPESGVVYKYRIRQNSGTLLKEGTIESTNTLIIEDITYRGFVVLELWTEREGVESMRRYNKSFSYTPPATGGGA